MTHTLRLISPQWQGGEAHNIANYVSELQPHEAMQGYAMRSQLLAWLAPPGSAVATVPVSMDASDDALRTEHGIFARQANLAQQQSALHISGAAAKRAAHSAKPPARACAHFRGRLRGEPGALQLPGGAPCGRCGRHLAGRPPRPAPAPAGLHRPARHDAGHLAGPGRCRAAAPAARPYIAPDKALIVGLRSPEGGDMQRPAAFGVAWQSAASANHSSADVLAWLAQTGARKVLVHLDLDVLELTELKTAVASDSNGLTLAATSRLINDIAHRFDLIGLTIAEPMPREVIQLHRLLHSLPLMQ